MRKLFLAFILLIINFQLTALFAAPNMTAEVTMDIRATTAAAAKKDAGESAVRSGVMQVLARYSDRAVVENLIMGAEESNLQNLVASTGITNEKSSKTAYGAEFAITLDRAAVEKWYADNNVLNFLTAADEPKDRTVIAIDLPSGLADWAELNRFVRADGGNYGLALRSIYKNSATAYILANKRVKFRQLCLNNGWSAYNRDGILRITKY